MVCVLRLLCVDIAPIISGSSAAGFVPDVIGVMIFPGQIALQRIPVAWKRSAVCFVTPTIAALDADKQLRHILSLQR